MVARFFGAADAIREMMGAPIPPIHRANYDDQIIGLRKALGEEAYASAWEAGRIMTEVEAVSSALAGDAE